MLLASNIAGFGAPQTPFSDIDSGPVFSEPSFGQSNLAPPKFGQSFNESPFAATDFQENITFDLPESTHSISLKADQVKHWVEGNFEVLYLLGNVRVQQAALTATAGEAIIWIEIPQDSPLIRQPNFHIRYSSI